MCVLANFDNRFNDRLAIQDITNYFLKSDLVLTYFFLQAGIGFTTILHDRPTVANALESLRANVLEVYSGQFIWLRHQVNTSHWSLLLLSGGFKKPRELTWVIAFTLGIYSVSFGATGSSSLAYEQGWDWMLEIVSGDQIAYPSLVELSQDCVPVVGRTWVEKSTTGLQTSQMSRLLMVVLTRSRCIFDLSIC